VVTGWLSQLEAAGRSVATRRRKLAAVLSFYRYAAAEGLALTPPVPHQVPKLHRDDADTGALDTAQARRLWEATAGQPRTRALVAVLLLCGLRIGDALTLNVADLDTQQGAAVLRVTGKGAKPRTAACLHPPSWPSAAGSPTAATTPGRCSPPAPALRRGRRSLLQRFRCCRRMAGAEGRPCSLCRCGPAAWGFRHDELRKL